MVGGYPANTEDLLGTSFGAGNDLFSPGSVEPGKTVDLSGGSSSFSMPQQPASSYGPGSSGSSFSSSSHYYAGGGSGSGSGTGSRGPSSIEGGNSGYSLSGLTPANIMRQLASRPVTELVSEQGKNLLQVPRYMARAYSAAARKYLRPWGEFARISPARLVEGLRQASRRGEIQIHIQRNVLSNVRQFCPNYAFIFLAMLFMFVCTSPMLLLMLCGVGGGWSHALRSENFRSRPWTLQIGGVQVPLGSNVKMAVLSLPTLLFLHFFMGPVLWSAALCSGGISLAHAALRDRDESRDDHDDDEHGLGHSSVRIRELP